MEYIQHLGGLKLMNETQILIMLKKDNFGEKTQNAEI